MGGVGGWAMGKAVGATEKWEERGKGAVGAEHAYRGTSWTALALEVGDFRVHFVAEL